MSRRTSLGLVGVLVVLAYAVPYTLLRSVSAWYGSFLFWIVLGVAVIGLNAAAMRGFGGRQDD
ncbi:hypothetical protein [Falsirhodobacter algicola]|uniref:Uncharacterized protein n=1 Tax=Falsirhodobacter algicola TaxID=2692330 RepID=A0A8J8MU24_9RHOB|nr:hypothetical protein [Falsirhodobacter algicola]QUS36243.1 hypothetical protein GR316_08145 [Falsirhodobacter algicola]